MAKNYVLDTNVLIHDPEAILKFDENDVFVPIFVIEEVDQFKREGTERGRNCRHFSRLLDELRSSSKKTLSDGIQMGDGRGILTVYLPKDHDSVKSLDHGAMDKAILNSAVEIRDRNKKKVTIFVTMDTNLRIRADAIGMAAETYENSRTEVETNSSVVDISAPKNEIDDFFTHGRSVFGIPEGLRPNASVLYRNEVTPSHTALGRYYSLTKEVRQLSSPKEGVMGIRPKNKEQAFALDLLLDDNIQLVTLIGKAGTGKSQPVSEPVMTPVGPVSMGNIKKGDYVLGRDGNPTKVLDVYPQGELDIFEVTFSDGSHTRCSEDHLWDTKTYFERNNGSPYKTRTTREIIETLHSCRNDRRKNHSIPTANPVEFDDKNVLIDPYLMGLMLGDGCLRHNVIFSTSDEEIINSFKDLLPEGTVIRQKSKYDWTFKRLQRDNSQHDLRVALRGYGLYGTFANSKFIPDDYKINSTVNRIALLQGLLDSDGTLDYRYSKNISFTTVSDKLRDDIIFLVQSLGGLARYKCRVGTRYNSGEKLRGQTAYVVSISLPKEIPPFRLLRKINSYKPAPGKGNRALIRYIVDVRKIGREECQCLRVDASDNLYLTNNFIVTHNTLLAIAAGLTKTIDDGSYTKMLVSRPVMPLGKDIGFLPGSVDEKLNPWMQPIFDNLEFLFGHGRKEKSESSYAELLESGVVQVEPLTYIRGRSLPGQYLIVDEAQNLTPHEIKTIITRAGEGSKIVLTGDPEQIDNPYVDASSNGLSVVTDRFRDQIVAGHVVLTKGERSKLAELAANLL